MSRVVHATKSCVTALGQTPTMARCQKLIIRLCRMHHNVHIVFVLHMSGKKRLMNRHPMLWHLKRLVVLLRFGDRSRKHSMRAWFHFQGSYFDGVWKRLQNVSRDHMVFFRFIVVAGGFRIVKAFQQQMSIHVVICSKRKTRCSDYYSSPSISSLEESVSVLLSSPPCSGEAYSKLTKQK